MNTRSVALFAEQAMKRGSKRLISVPAMVSDLRGAFPECEHTDEELAQLVTMVAVANGHDLSFIRRAGFDAVDS